MSVAGVIKPLAALLLLAGSISSKASPQGPGASNLLPPPTGPSVIGRITYHWVDSSRAEFLQEDAPGRRELIVDVWYPAGPEPARPVATYLPDLGTLRAAIADSLMLRHFAPAYAAMEAGRLTTHAVEASRAQCPPDGCPVLVFSHGGGVDRSFYTAQYEDFASHGYLVAAVAHTFDTHVVVFPDGRVITAAPARPDTMALDRSIPAWRHQLERERRSEAYVQRIIQVEADDIRFVIDQLTRYAYDPALGAPFFRRANLNAIGALGHSAGGEAAARACQLDARIRACLNQDGVMHNLPFARDTAGRTMKQPFMYISREYKRPPLSDSQLSVMEMTRAQADSVFHAIATGQDELLADMPAGAYRVTLTVPGMTHMSFSDEPLIEASGDSVKTANALLALRIVGTYSRAFFDHTLFGKPASALGHPNPADSAFVRVERFRPKSARGPVRQ